MKKLKQLACGLLAAALLVCALPAAGAEGTETPGQPAPTACTAAEDCTLEEGHKGACNAAASPANGPVYVAAIGEQGYETLKAALQAVPQDGTETVVTLLADTQEVISVPGVSNPDVSNWNAVLDLNGHTLTGRISLGVIKTERVKNSTLTIQDTSPAQEGKIVGTKKDAAVWNAGSNTTVKLLSGSIINYAEPQSRGIELAGDSSALEIHGGYVYGNQTGVYHGGGTLKMDAGAVKGASRGMFIYTNDGKAELTGGTINGTKDNGSGIVISGCASLQIGSQNASDSELQISDLYYSRLFNSSTEVKIYSGTIEGISGEMALVSTEILGGSFSEGVTEEMLRGHVPKGSAIISRKSGQTGTVYAVGGSAEQLAAQAKAGDTITVLQGDSVEVPDKVTVENKTGKDITVNGVAVPDNGTLTAHRHSAVHVAAKAPTAGQGGNIEYWYCEGCGKYFKDAALTQETTAEGVKLPATGSTPAPAPTQKANPKTGM